MAGILEDILGLGEYAHEKSGDWRRLGERRQQAAQNVYKQAQAAKPGRTTPFYESLPLQVPPAPTTSYYPESTQPGIVPNYWAQSATQERMPAAQEDPMTEEHARATSDLYAARNEMRGKGGSQDNALAQYFKLQSSALEAQKKGDEDLARRLEEMRKSEGKQDISGLLAGIDMMTGSQLSKNYRAPKSKEKREIELLGLEMMLQKRRGDTTKSELSLLKQRMKTSGLPGETTASKAVDTAFGKEYAEYIAGGGYADVNKSVEQLKQVQKGLKSGQINTGNFSAYMPEWMRTAIDEKNLSAQQAVEEVVQRNLRLVLGAQFTEKEGERLISRAYNPRLNSAENSRRLGRLLNQIQTAAKQKQRASDHYEKYGTLRGFKGNLPHKSDFNNLFSMTDAQLKRRQELLRKAGR